MIDVEITAKVYEFRGNEVRVIERDGEPWFVANDIGDALGLTRSAVRDITRKLPGQFKGVDLIDTLGGLQNLTIIAYEGAVKMILRSRKPEAEAFQDWLAFEVVPSIRRKGFYRAEPLTEEEMLVEVTEATAAAARKLLRHRQQLDNHEYRITTIEETTEKNREHLRLVERSDAPVRPKTTRSKVNELVRAYSLATGNAFSEVWGTLYKELRYRYGFDAPRRARNAKQRPLDMIEKAGHMENLFAVASEILEC